MIFSLAFEFDSNCEDLRGLAVLIEFKCFVSVVFSDRFWDVLGRFGWFWTALALSFFGVVVVVSSLCLEWWLW